MRITFNIGAIIGGIISLFRGRKKRPYVTEDVSTYKTKEQFVDLVKNTFGGEFNIIENYDARYIDPAAVEARPYNLAFFRGDQLVLTILFTKHNGDRNKYFVNAKRACELRGIRCLNFFEHFPNHDDYVITRIRESL